MRYLTYGALLGILFLFAACHKDNIDASPDSKVMSFETQVEPIDEVLTRGTPITAVTQMTSMGVFAYNTGNNSWADASEIATSNYMHNQEVTQREGKWSYEPIKYWPKTNTTLFAYSPHATSSNGISVKNEPYIGAPTIQYTVPSTCVNQPDLMVAVRQEDKNSGAVSLTMKHALACVSFKIKGTYSEQITKIAVKGVSVSGTLSLDNAGETAVWSNLAAPTSAEYTSGMKGNMVAGATMVDATAADGYLMMIPQTLGPDAQIVVTMNGEDKAVAIDGKTWEAGRKYTYSLTIKSTEIIIGMFGGWDGNRYANLLQVESVVTNSDPQHNWSVIHTETGATNKAYGRANIDLMKVNDPSLSNLIAAKHCDDKGSGWYLPSQNQLMAIWVTASGIESKYGGFKSSYFSSTEIATSLGAYVIMTSGYTSNNRKDMPRFVRCVRDVEITGTEHVQVVLTQDNKLIIDNQNMPAGAITVKEKTRTTTATNHLVGTDSNNDISSAASNLTVSHYFELAKKDLSANIDWLGAVDGCANWTEDGGKWRLPTQRELQLIFVVYETAKTKQNDIPMLQKDYWSATEFDNARSWYVSLGSGVTANLVQYPKTTLFAARCVRDLEAPAN